MPSNSAIAILCTLVIFSLQTDARPDVVVVTPNVLQSDNVQFVLVSVTEIDRLPITITLEDNNNYVYKNVGSQIVYKDAPKLFNFTVSCKDIPVHTQHQTRLVYVRAVAIGQFRYNRKFAVALSCKSSLVFIQTDKPVYTKDDTVHIRIVSVDRELKPKFSDKVTVDIKNPDGIVIDRLSLTSSSESAPVIKKYELQLGPSPVEGQYTIIAKYGFEEESVSEFFFEVKDYVLPRFDVQIVPPHFITKDQKTIVITFLAKYTYGKGVVGDLYVKLGICQKNSTKMNQFFKNSFRLYSADRGEKTIGVPNIGYNIFPAGDRLCIFAEVSEHASGISQSSLDSSAWFTYTPVNIDCDLNPPFYRPQSLLYFTARARYPDGRAAKNTQLTAEVKGFDPQKATTSGDGLAHFFLNIGNPSPDTEIEVLLKIGQNLGTKCRFRQFRSLCGSKGRQLTVRPTKKGKLEVGREANFELETTNNGKQTTSYVIVILSRGAIQGYKFLKSNGSTTSFQMDVTANLANKFCLLAYFTDTCGALVADKVCCETSNVFQNNVSVSIATKGRGDVRPGKEVTISVKAAKYSDVALLAVDKGLYILNNNNKLTQDQVFDDLLGFDKSCGYSGIDTRAVFDAAGLAAVNSLWRRSYSYERFSIDCPSHKSRRSADNTDTSCLCTFGKTVINSIRNESRGLQPNLKDLLESRCDMMSKNIEQLEAVCGPVETVKELETFVDCCLNSLDDRARNSPSDFNEVIETDIHQIQRRTEFPHAWLWDMKIKTGEDGTWGKTITVPDSITTWVFHGLTLSGQDGFGVAKPQELAVVKTTFAECHLPYSFRRQEQVSVACTVYNYNQRGKIKVCLRLVDPPEDLCTTAGKGKQTDFVCHLVASDDTLTVLLPILPLKTGEIKLTVQLRTFFEDEELVQEIKVEPEGVLREYDYSTELDPQGENVDKQCSTALTRERRQAEDRGVCYTIVKKGKKCGQPLHESLTKQECCDNKIGEFAVAWGEDCQLCPRSEEIRETHIPGIPGGKLQKNKYYIRVPENHIEGSVSAWIGITGRYLEANIKPISGIEDLLRLPGGCGEQSLIRFGPNVAIAKYLKATGNLPPEREKSLLDLIRRGYIYQQTYRHESGGFTAFPNEIPATWLSAFALRSFCAAKDLIFVDDKVITGILNFLVNKRQKDTGEYFEGSRVRQRTMVGGVQEGDVSLTAYVVVSMLECCNSSNSHLLSQAVRSSMCKAIAYLKQRTTEEAVTRPYSRALVYYALAKSCTSCRICQSECQLANISNARHRLDLKATKEECSKHWQADIGHYQRNSYWYHKPSEISVEISSYALCAYVSDGNIEEARSIARWLNGQRNSRGAFGSTQDTVVALTCLGEFAKHIDVKHAITVNVTALHNKTFNKHFEITNDNYEVTQRTEVPINDVLTAVTTGDGLGLVQVHVEYNTPATSYEGCAFDFNVSTELVQNEALVYIGVCARYLGVNCTGMAIVEVEHLTGFEPCEKRPNNFSDDFCLKDILEGQLIAGLTKYEINGRSVVFYFNEICSADEKCFKYKMTEKFSVLHHVPVSAKVYDYYKQDIQCTKYFTVGEESPKLSVICRNNGKDKSPLCVCGAGRCPKLESIKNRVCNACVHHHYVYKIRVISRQYENGWIKFRAAVVEVFKPGARDVKPNSKKLFWIPSICEESVSLEDGKEYHLQGKDGPKFILDHSSHIEQWLPKFEDCAATRKSRCLKERCSRKKSPQARKACFASRTNESQCKKKGKMMCKDSKKFETYVAKIRQLGTCEVDVCNKDKE